MNVDFNPYPDLAPPLEARPQRGLRALELGLLLVGLAFVGFWATATLGAMAFQARHLAAPAPAGDLVLAPGTVLGRIELPEIGVRSVIVEGVGDEQLELAVGHIPGTALPGEPGNAALAAHRDTWFRGLRHVEPGHRVLVTSPFGELEYRVVETRVVEPDAIDVLEAEPGETALTLVTCHPFSFIGRAPRRFIVRAEPIDGVVAAQPIDEPLAASGPPWTVTRGAR